MDHLRHLFIHTGCYLKVEVDGKITVWVFYDSLDTEGFGVFMGRRIPFHQKRAHSRGIDVWFVGIEEIYSLLGIFDSFTGKAEKEERMIPDAGLGAFLEDTAHVGKLCPFDHMVDDGLGRALLNSFPQVTLKVVSHSQTLAWKTGESLVTLAY